MAYAYVTSLHGRSGGPGFALPLSSMLTYDEATNQVVQDESGNGDLNLTFDYNLRWSHRDRRSSYAARSKQFQTCFGSRFLGAGFAAWPGGAAILGYNRTFAHDDGGACVNTYMLQLLHKF